MNRQRGKRRAGMRRAGASILTAAMLMGTLGDAGLTNVFGASLGVSWKSEITAALNEADEAIKNGDKYQTAVTDMEGAIRGLREVKFVEGLKVTNVTADSITLEWDQFVPEEADEKVTGYNVYWADKNLKKTEFLQLDDKGKTIPKITEEGTAPDPVMTVTGDKTSFVIPKSTFRNLYFKVAPVTTKGVGAKSKEVAISPTAVEYKAKMETLDRGMTATLTDGGVYLNWRLFYDEVTGYGDTGLTGVNFNVYRGDTKLGTVTDSTNYLDAGQKTLDGVTYKIVPVVNGEEQTTKACTTYEVFAKDPANKNVAIKDIPLQKPADTTIAAEYGIDRIVSVNSRTDSYGEDKDFDGDAGDATKHVITYSANDCEVADADGDGEYEYFVKWDPSLSKDVSQVGYTGRAYIDCYKLDGTLLWRLDLGKNIRAGAHYTEFGVFDYDEDGKAEIMVKTAPGSKMIKYEIGADGKNVKNADGKSLKIASEKYVTNTPEAKTKYDAKDDSDYVFSAAEYRDYMIEYFQHWGKWDNYPKSIVDSVIDCEGGWSNNLVEMFTVDVRWRDAKFYIGDDKNNSVDLKALGSSMSDEKVVAEIKKYIKDYDPAKDKLVNVCLYDDAGNARYPGAGAPVANLKTVRVQDVKDYFGGYNLASVDKDAKGTGYTKEEATLLTDYFLKHYQYRMRKHNLNLFEGYVITGPEYISLFDCSNGDELDTQNWYFDRIDDGMLWCDYALDFMEPGNRVDRFNVVVAYLDGVNPSCVMGRGYYSRTTMAAYNVENKKLKLVGSIDSGFSRMKNPFNDYHGADGVDPVTGPLAGQGDHYIAVADVDGDGRQDIINGGAIVSYDKANKMYLYSSGKAMNTQTKQVNKYGHGDCIHITDIDPDRPGLEIASCFESGAGAAYDWAVRDCETNTALFGVPGSSDFGRLMIGDNLPNVRGIEISTGKDAKNNSVSLIGWGNNMNIKWDVDMSTQFIAGSEDKNQPVSITGNKDGKEYTFLRGEDYRANNWTKGNPCLVADIFGDTREELLVRKTDSTSLRLYMNTENFAHKNYTLMQNLQYRVGIASQNSAYNQPAYTDYYYAADTDWEYVWLPNRGKDQEPGAVTAPAAVTAVTAEDDTKAVAAVDDVSVEEADVKAAGADIKVEKVDVLPSADSDLVLKPVEDYLFDFGTKNGEAGAPFKYINSNLLYDKEKGYGFAEDYGLDSKDLGNTYATPAPDSSDDYDATLARAASDAIRKSGKELEFKIDLPAGTYQVNVYAANKDNDNYNNNRFYINDVDLGKVGFEIGASLKVSEYGVAAKVTLKEPGQIVVKAGQCESAGKNFSFISAITVNTYASNIDDADSTKWDAYKTAVTELRTAMASVEEKEHSGKDFTVALVRAMQKVDEAAKAVRNMMLEDTTEGETIYANAEEKLSEAEYYVTVEDLEKAVKAYQAAKENLVITEQIDNVVTALDLWLDGISIVSTGEGTASPGEAVTADPYDSTDLKALLAKIGDGVTGELTLGEGTVKEEAYTISSWEKLKAAYIEAAAAVKDNTKSRAYMIVISNNLLDAWENLTETKPVTAYAIDFGPARDVAANKSESDPKIANANVLTMEAHDFSLAGKLCTLVTGDTLYAENGDDNRSHFGMKEPTKAMNTPDGGAYFRDYVYGENGAPYTFMADVAEGYWYVYVYTGDKSTNHTVDFYFNDGKAAYNNNAAGVKAGSRKVITPQRVEDGKTIYTQAGNGGGQYAAADAVYRVYVPESAAGSGKGVFSITCFDPEKPAGVTARLNGLEMSHMTYAKALQETMNELKVYAGDDFATSSLAEAAKLLQEAEGLVSCADEKKADVVEMIDKLSAAVDQLERKGDATKLQAKVNEVKGYKEASYTKESWAKFSEALKNAQALLKEGVAPTQKEADAALDALEKAIKGLVKAPTGPAKGKTVTAKDGTKYVVTNQGKEVAYKAPKNQKATSITVQDTVTIDGIKYNVTSIAKDAFKKKNTKLKKVTIGKNVTSIGKDAFSGCKKLDTVTFKKGSKCKTIGDNAFKGTVIKKITLPDSVTTIGANAFANCKNLQNVTIGKGLTTIGKAAFSGDGKLTKITIKSTKLNKVGKNALKGTSKKLVVKVPKKKLSSYRSKFKGKGNKKVTVKK